MGNGFHAAKQGCTNHRNNAPQALAATLILMLLGSLAFAQQEMEEQPEQTDQQREQEMRQREGAEAGSSEAIEQQRRLMISGPRNVLNRGLNTETP